MVSVCGVGAGCFAAECPTTSEQWGRIQKAIASSVGTLASARPVDAVMFLNRAKSDTVTLSAAEMEACLKVAPPKIQACMGNPARWYAYASAFTFNDGEEAAIWKELNRPLKMKAYFKQYATLLEVPEELSDTPLLKILTNGHENKSTPTLTEWDSTTQRAQVEAKLNEINNARAQKGKLPMEWLFYRSQQPSIGLSSTHERLLLKVPERGPGGESVEKWIQFAPGGNLVGVISVVENPPGKFQSYFKDNIIAPTKGGSIQELKAYVRRGDRPPKPLALENSLHVAHPEFNVGSEACTSCHVSGGPFPIWPTGKLSQKDDDIRRRFNARFSQYGSSFSSSEYPRPREIPRLGEQKPRELASVEACSKKLGGASARKILGAMNCTKCHDDESRTGIRLPLSSNNSGWISTIVNGHMPPDNNLSKEERASLVECLLDDYSGPNGTLVQWINATPCVVAPDSVPAPKTTIPVPATEIH